MTGHGMLCPRRHECGDNKGRVTDGFSNASSNPWNVGVKKRLREGAIRIDYFRRRDRSLQIRANRGYSSWFPKTQSQRGDWEKG